VFSLAGCAVVAYISTLHSETNKEEESVRVFSRFRKTTLRSYLLFLCLIHENTVLFT